MVGLPSARVEDSIEQAVAQCGPVFMLDGRIAMPDGRIILRDGCVVTLGGSLRVAADDTVAASNAGTSTCER